MKILEDQKPIKTIPWEVDQKIDLAYIAGFLDGDGSLMLQIKKRRDGKSKIRFMSTICFYQDTRHEDSLLWIQQVLGIGYISRRKDSMTELRINGFDRVLKILTDLQPYVRFKKVQVEAVIKACKILKKANLKKLSNKQLLQLVELILIIQAQNYVTRRKKTREELITILGLTP